MTLENAVARLFVGGNEPEAGRFGVGLPFGMADKRHLVAKGEQTAAHRQERMQISTRPPGGQQPAHRAGRHRAAGCCWVMQCSAPRPQIRSSDGQTITRRVGNSSCKIAAARASFG